MIDHHPAGGKCSAFHILQGKRRIQAGVPRKNILQRLMAHKRNGIQFVVLLENGNMRCGAGSILESRQKAEAVNDAIPNTYFADSVPAVLPPGCQGFPWPRNVCVPGYQAAFLLIGTEPIRADLTGVDTLTLRLFCPPLMTEQFDPFDSKQGLFLGDAVLTRADGSSLRLADLPRQTVNIDLGFGIGRDYENGRVLISGKQMDDAIPLSPLDHHQEAVLTIDLRGLNAVRLEAELGVDAFPGDEQQRRRTYAIQTSGTEARFVTVIEPFENRPMISRVESVDADTVKVYLADGRQQTVQITGLTSGQPAVMLMEKETMEILPALPKEEEA